MRHLDVAKDIVMKGTSQLTLHASTDPDVASVQVPELELLDSSTLQFSGDLTIDAASSFVIDPAATVTGKAGGVPAGNSMPGCPNDGGRHRVGEEVRSTTLPQHVDDLAQSRSELREIIVGPCMLPGVHALTGQFRLFFDQFFFEL